MITNQIPPNQEQFTGRYLVLLNTSARKSTIKRYAKQAGITFASSSELSETVDQGIILEAEDGLIFEDLGVGIVNNKPGELTALIESNGNNPFYYKEPETYMYALSEVDYIRGFADATNMLYDAFKKRGWEPVQENDNAGQAVDTKATWGLKATKVPDSILTGKGVNIAVLDTGIHGGHPDFVGRNIVGKSFIPNEVWNKDGHGHGTHCIGTACGGHRKEDGLRYGIARESNIFVGKVLSNAGHGASGGVIEGVQWALEKKCKVISMSLGSFVTKGQKPSPIFERVGHRALGKGALIIAAAGNDSRRPRYSNPVSSPANCESIMAVGALNRNLKVAHFSNRGINEDGGKVDIAAPGMQVLSSWILKKNKERYHTLNGTSMATTHVAGIATLLCEAYPDASPEKIWNNLIRTAKGIGLPYEDAGAGMVQALIKRNLI